MTLAARPDAVTSRGLLPSSDLLAVFTVCCLAVLCGCTSVREIRVQNVSTLDYTDVSVGDQTFGDIAAGATSDYRSVGLRFRYAALKLKADGQYVTGQTLNMGAKRFTYRIDIVDLAAGHLAIEVIRDE